MLIYLFFVFSCGWCVCWLLFLNYQQHANDSSSQEEQHNLPSPICGRQIWGSGKKRKWFKHLPYNKRFNRQKQQQQQSAMVIDDKGKHSLMPIDDEFGESLKLNGADDYCQDEMDEFHYNELNENYTNHNQLLDLRCNNVNDDELLHIGIVGGQDDNNVKSLIDNSSQLCEHCQLAASGKPKLLDTKNEMRGWPIEFNDEDENDETFDTSLVDFASGTGELNGEQVTLVELHENPLNVFANCSQQTLQLPLLSPSDTLDRSRKLSLLEDQQDRRAAVRMVSSGISLFVYCFFCIFLGS